MTDEEMMEIMQGSLAKRDAIVRNAAIDDCLKLMAKWFYMSNKDAKACVNEMLALKVKPK